MRALMYGYLRVDLVAGQVGQWERRIQDFADDEGFDLGMVFREQATDRGAFAALIRELRRAESRHVVVPSMTHVWGPGQERHAFVARLWHEAAAGVWVADNGGGRLAEKVGEPADRGAVVTDVDEWTREIRLAGVETSVAVARVQTRCALSRWQLAELQAPAERLVEELLRATITARRRAWREERPLVVRLVRGEHLLIEVWDKSPAAAEPPFSPRVTMLSGRHGHSRPPAGGVLTWCELGLSLPIEARRQRAPR